MNRTRPKDPNELPPEQQLNKDLAATVIKGVTAVYEMTRDRDWWQQNAEEWSQAFWQLAYMIDKFEDAEHVEGCSKEVSTTPSKSIRIQHWKCPRCIYTGKQMLLKVLSEG